MKRRRYRKKTPPLNIHLFLCALYIAGAVFMDFHFIVLLIGLVIPYLGVITLSPYAKVVRLYKKGNPEWATINVKIKSPFLNPYMTIPIIIITILAIFFMGYDYVFARLIVHYGVFEVRDALAIFRSENIINTYFNRDHINAYGYFIVGLIHAITLYLIALYATTSLYRYKQQTMFTGVIRQATQSKETLEFIRTLSWREFEEFVRELFKSKGFEAQTTKYGLDNVKDIILQKDGMKAIAQCKHWKTEQVGIAVAREMIGVLEADKEATHVFLVTSGSFSNDAILFRQQVADRLTLIDGNEIVNHFLNSKN
ncbi:restriction endonuclease (plasmid) [Arsenophonus nasoniae]|uniref:Restriction endonuclease n=1 Tax=Arsenophonus nasoniae TaxID=638 RepID=D2U0T2_9GAMM|nr:restriction endonuclease [Arsenophonus nasoniae]QBY46573.1 Restriction endonuclease [Arsenophonus nasoniae]WGM08413.1 restriction endonuclease [Arsenophonus nasoniae]WGM13277.1 restriction endonuclease [Arsenophonus nasoniae]WGM17935.1 restriction endonuclease [Arsenophonus nasoniae]CBA74085.1 restriction endonuclease [Arsenophonus nasoniae]